MTLQERDHLIDRLRNAGSGNTVSEEMLNMFHVRKTDDIMIPTRDGETHVYIHYPNHDQTPHPLFVNIHGGGFIKAHRQQDTVFSKNICSRANCVVIDIDYVPVPEQRYPYAMHQCYDTVKWACENLDVDLSRVVMCGHSAGGNLVAAIAIMNQEKHDFNLRLQILDYPCLDLHTPPQLKYNAYQNPKLPPNIVRMVESAYVDDENRLLPTVSPLFAPDRMLAGLPEALIITCGDDYLGEEAEKYAFRLLEAGVAVTGRRFLSSGHGFVVRRNGQFEEAETMIFDALHRAFR